MLNRKHKKIGVFCGKSHRNSKNYKRKTKIRMEKPKKKRIQ